MDIAKSSGIDQISAKFLKNGAPVIAIHLVNTINLSIKLDAFPSKCKIAKIKRLFKKRIETKGHGVGRGLKLKITNLFFYCF